VNSVFNVIYSAEAQKQFRKMDRQTAKRIITWVEERLIGCQNPRLWGAALVGEFSGFWKYRIGSYRLICEIKDNELVVQVIDIGNRKEVYR
jgi:mRNA interferase RelE/StbE